MGGGEAEAVRGTGGQVDGESQSKPVDIHVYSSVLSNKNSQQILLLIRSVTRR